MIDDDTWNLYKLVRGITLSGSLYRIACNTYEDYMLMAGVLEFDYTFTATFHFPFPFLFPFVLSISISLWLFPFPLPSPIKRKGSIKQLTLSFPEDCSHYRDDDTWNLYKLVHRTYLSGLLDRITCITCEDYVLMAWSWTMTVCSRLPFTFTLPFLVPFPSPFHFSFTFPFPFSCPCPYDMCLFTRCSNWSVRVETYLKTCSIHGGHILGKTNTCWQPAN